ncbi:adenylate/guanylate cyclase domain-containing protein [Litorimonas sp. WD9-15]|uniref:adenylate/guanylate cyclase domain-containing protein n=1 Tax=Litorimonas sp. WD9-15 TaxID=3418716 RepID=UPI003CFC93F7
MDSTGNQKTHQDDRRLTTIIVADICDYASLSEIDEVSTINLADTTFEIFANIVEQYKGRVFKRIADGFLAELPSARSGIQAAIDFKTSFSAHQKTLGHANDLAVRIGIHIGDVIDRPDGDILGHGVNIAARLQENARRNGILASAQTINMLGQDTSFRKIRRRNLTLKNISESILAFDIDSETPKTFQRLYHMRRMIQGRTALVSVVGLAVAAALTSGIMIANDQSLSRKVETVQNRIFYDQKRSAYENEIGASYLYQVLKDIAASNQSSDKAVFAMIEAGNVEDAISALEEELATLDKTNPDHLNILNQIGALSFKMNPQRSVEVYERIVALSPKDVFAQRNLGKSYDTVGRVCDARARYKMALQNVPPGTEQYMRLEMDLAFNHYLKREIGSALNILEFYETDMQGRDRDALWSQYHTELGIVLEGNAELLKSKAVLSSIIDGQKQIEDLANLSRSRNVLGLIALREAQDDPKLAKYHLPSARDHFKEQRRIDVELERNHSIPEADYYLGQVFLALEDWDAAKMSFREGLDVANREGIVNIQFLNTLGLAMAEKAEGNDMQACDYVSSAQGIYNEKIDSGIGPKTRAKITDLNCGFVYKPQSPRSSTCPD